MKKIFTAIIGISFLLNVVWENIQAPLYQGYGGFWNHLPFCFLGALGDAAAISISYWLVDMSIKKVNWFRHPTLVKLFIFLLFELAIAFLVERGALSNNLWAYTDSMPLLLGTKIGIYPLIQLMVTGIVSILLVKSSKNTDIDYKL